MRYIHPAKYKGLKFNDSHNQTVCKALVEKNCLKCDLFCGKEHDFSECKRNFYSKSNEITCPLECRKGVSLINPESEIKCESEDAVNYTETEKAIKEIDGKMLEVILELRICRSKTYKKRLSQEYNNLIKERSVLEKQRNKK